MKKILFLLLASSLIFVGCKKKSISNNCCGTPSFKETFSGGHVALPNIFTPDNDGINDYFAPVGEGFSNYALKIVGTKKTLYNTNSSQPWDGIAEDGKAVRDIVGWELNVSTIAGDLINYRGQVCVIRASDDICPKNLKECAVGEVPCCIFGNQYDAGIKNFDVEKEHREEALCSG